MNALKKIVKRSDYWSRLYRGVRDQLNRNLPLEDTSWGFKLSGHRGMASGEFEQEETKLVRDFLIKSDLFVNAGANIGYYVCHALSLQKEVIAIEPVCGNVHYLMKNMHANEWSQNVEIYPLAAGEKQDILPIWGGGTGASLIKGWASNPVNYFDYVPVQTLDRIVNEKAKKQQLFILLDVEGYEYHLLKGALKLLYNEPKPIWMVEITKTEHQPNDSGNPWFLETFKLFFNAGYRAFKGDRHQEEVLLEDVEAMDERRCKSTCINYIFKHNDL